MGLHGVQRKTLNSRRSGNVYAKALKSQQSLKKSIETLSQATGVQFRSALKDAQRNIKHLEDFFSICLDSTFDTSTPTADSTVVMHKVFGTPELAEEIFSYLLPMDLLRAQMVNRTMADVIQSSRKLQKRMFLISDENMGFVALSLDKDVSISITCGPLVQFRDQALRIKVGVDTKAGVPRLGSRARQMQLCQPRLHGLKVRLSCCQYDFQPLRYVENPDGVTLGDLYDVVKTVKNEHRFCLKAGISSHDHEGFIRPVVIFEGRLQLRSDDPLAVEIIEADETVHQWERTGYKWQQQLRDYIYAKWNAHLNHKPIPTLAEYKRSLQTVGEEEEAKTSEGSSQYGCRAENGLLFERAYHR